MKEPTNADILSAVRGVEAGIGSLTGEVHELNRRIQGVESRLGAVEETLEPLSKAFDRDAVKVFNHEGRITALERKFT